MLLSVLADWILSLITIFLVTKQKNLTFKILYTNLAI